MSEIGDQFRKDLKDWKKKEYNSSARLIEDMMRIWKQKDLTKKDDKDHTLLQELRKLEYVDMGKVSEALIDRCMKRVKEIDGDIKAFATELVKYKLHFAHIEDSHLDQFNSWVYRNNKWTEDSGNVILEILLKVNIPSFQPDNKLAANVAKDISGADHILKISFDENYMNERMNWMIGPDGKYFDLSDGKIKDIDPTRQFFETCDLQCAIKESEEPVEYIEFLKSMFGDKWEIARDHEAGKFLHAAILGSKPKLLNIIGKTNTWKSFFLELHASLLDDRVVSNVSKKQMDNDSVFGPATIVNRISNYHEEGSPEMPKNYSAFKDIITKIGGSVRRMHTTKTVQAYRWPRWTVASNKASPMTEDDEDDSIFEREMYLETQTQSGKDWREILLNDAMREKILYYLLRRAFEIRQNPESIQVQTLEEARTKYEYLRRGDLDKFIENNCITNEQDTTIGESTGIKWIFFKNEFKRQFKTNASVSLLVKSLEELGYEKKSNVYCMDAPDDSLETYQLCSREASGPQKTLIMGLKWKVKRMQKLDK